MPGFSDQVDEGLRVIGRLAALAGASLLALFLFGVALKPLLPDGLPAGPDGRMIFLIIVACALAIGHLLAGIVLERGRWEPTGLGATAWHPLALLTGPALGVVAIAAPAVGLLLLGSVGFRVEARAGWSAYAADAFLPVAVLTLVSALSLRGYAIGLIAERWGDVAAVVLTSLAAAVIHLREPSVSAGSIVGVIALALCLGAIRLRTGSLATSWLAHLAFGWTQVAILHSPLRGVDLPVPPGYALIAAEPEWLTGGANGVSEGAAVAVSLAVVIFLVFRPRRANARLARV